MVGRCCVPGCKESFVKGGPFTFHSFPKNEERRKLWEIKIPKKNFKAKHFFKICSKHFTEDCYDKLKFGGSWLKANAVPTLFNFPDQQQNTVKINNSVKSPQSIQIEAVDCNVASAKSTWEKLNTNKDVLEKETNSNKIKHSETVTQYTGSPRPYLQSSTSVLTPIDIITKIENSALKKQEVLQRNNINVIKLEKSCSTDELFYFFMSMYKTTKKMPPASQHYIRKNIFQLVSDTEAKLLNLDEISHDSYQKESMSSRISDASNSERYYRLKKL